MQKMQYLKSLALMAGVVSIISFNSEFTNAQNKYGGSASVIVEDKSGNSRVLNETTGCWNNDEESTKSELISKLKKGMKKDEKLFLTSIDYSIDECIQGSYGGSASVTIEDEDGNRRIEKADVPCGSYMNIANLKVRLKLDLNLRWNTSGEKYVTSIDYNIIECEK